MRVPDMGYFSHPATPLQFVVNDLVRLNSQHHLGYDDNGLNGLLAQAEAGKDVEIPLVPNNLWRPDGSPESEALESALDGGWSYNFEEWLWEHGQSYDGTSSEEVHDQITGNLTNRFLEALALVGTVVELSTRQDEARGEVAVNNVWKLSRLVGSGEFTPMATVHTVDADLGKYARWEQSDPRGPSSLRIPHPVLVGKKVVLLAGLALSEPSE